MDARKNRKSLLDILRDRGSDCDQPVKYDSTNLSDDELSDKLDYFLNIDRQLTPNDYNEIHVLAEEALRRNRADNVFAELGV